MQFFNQESQTIATVRSKLTPQFVDVGVKLTAIGILAAIREAPRPRRDHSSSLISEAPAGNSRSSHSRNSGLLLYSPRLRQYFFPVSGSGGCWKTRFIGGRFGNLCSERCPSVPSVSDRSPAALDASSSSNPQSRFLAVRTSLRTPPASHRLVSNRD